MSTVYDEHGPMGNPRHTPKYDKLTRIKKPFFNVNTLKDGGKNDNRLFKMSLAGFGRVLFI